MDADLARQADLADIKEHLDIAFVMHSHGYLPEAETDGKLHYLSPFREDEDPSFDVFMKDGFQRWGDFGEGTQGDSIDLVKRFQEERGSHANAPLMSRCRDILAAQCDSDWEAHVIEAHTREPFDVTIASELAAVGVAVSGTQTWQGLISNRPGLADVSPPTDRVVGLPDSGAVAFFLKDEYGEVQGVRLRYPDGRKQAKKGSRNILMRMGDPAPELPVFITEGETDTWAAWGALRGEYEVLGIPGASTSPQKAGADALAGRTVYLALDPDSVGETARALWSAYLTGQGCSVLVCIVPAGKDISKLYPEDIRKLPTSARVQTPLPPSFRRSGPAYVKVGVAQEKGGESRETETPVTNWSLVPTSVLKGDDGAWSYEGALLPSGRTVVLPSAALRSINSLNAWGAPHQASFYGSATQVHKLAALLANESAYLPEGRTSDQVGLSGSTFVWPDGSIGDDRLSYVPPKTAAIQPAAVFVQHGSVSVPEVVNLMIHSQHSAITHPMIAWLAVAPLRTLYHEFPILNVTGLSGSGKTTLTQALLRMFSGSEITANITSTTPHAVNSLIDASRGFPVWIDEYRPGSRIDAKLRLDQLLRDAYTAQPSMKGGSNDQNLSALAAVRTHAPIIVTGEDSFSEVSHLDRSILVHVVREEQGPVDWAQSLPVGPFAARYLGSLTSTPYQMHIERPPVHEPPPVLWTNSHPGLGPRPARNVAMLHVGWELLQRFLWMENGPDLPPPDFSRVIEAYETAKEEDPIRDLLLLCYENDTPLPTVWRHPSEPSLCIHAQNVLTEAGRHASIVLPVSNARSLKRTLTEAYGAQKDRVRPLGSTNPVNVVKIPLSAVGLEEGEDQL